ncbi:MAG: MFS transporter, partial [Oscillospiraceae bacterium]|nr:MFS transporter [Oscillospiraceae bacterium]
FTWIKDSIIQIVFITFAVIFTVFIAQISISEQYKEYYEEKLAEKVQTLASNAVHLFSDNSEIRNAAGMSYILNIIFPIQDGEPEVVRYTLFNFDGTVTASTVEPGGDIPLFLPEEALSGTYTYIESPLVRSFEPVFIDGRVRYVLMTQIDDTPFLKYSEQLSESLYSSLFRGCFMMAGGYALFSTISNLRKKKDKETEEADDEETPEKKPEGNILSRFMVQLISMFVFALLSLLLFRLDGMAGVLIGGLFLAVAGVHLCRILLWFFAWCSKRPISTYAAQTMQFFVFLVVFLSMYVYTMQSGYSTQIELTNQSRLRISSVFAGLSLSGNEIVNDLSEQAQSMNFGEHSECLVMIRLDDTFVVLGDESQSIPSANDLFHSAWESQASVTGIRGEYKYGVTIIADSSYEVAALAVVRQLVSVQADETRGATIDFLLAMSATVFAFVFLFVEMNRMLEVINLPNLKRERGLRYAKSTRSLMFLANACRYIPLYFFVLIVRDIYEVNPVSWISGELATVLPIAVVLIVMAVGKDIAGLFIRLKARRMMIFGCLIGLAGFLLLNLAVTLLVLLLLLILTYTGVSMVYNGLWDFAANAANTGYKEFADIKEHTLSGEYLGGTAGAVIGAMVYDKFGLFAAFALSSVVLFILAVLIRALLPAGQRPVKAERREYGFFKFFFSKRVFLLMFLLLMPFVLGEYFIEQFSPLYAASIELSPGAASWTSLLMTMAIAYIAPSLVRAFTGRIGKTAICVLANMLAAAGLVLFALLPGIAAMYGASALIGVSVGVGKNILAAKYSEFRESQLYAHSGYVYNLFDSLFGLLGAALFTFVHIMSSGGSTVVYIAVIIVFATILYLMFSRDGRNKRI